MDLGAAAWETPRPFTFREETALQGEGGLLLVLGAKGKALYSVMRDRASEGSPAGVVHMPYSGCVARQALTAPKVLAT